MNAKDFSNAIGEVDEKYVTEAINYKHSRKRKTWGKWIAAAACVCLVLAGIFPLFNNQPGVSPFVLTAYALDSSNTLSAALMQEGENVPVSLFETEKGLWGFVFSRDCSDTGQSGAISIMSEGDNAASIDEIVGLATEQGKQYYFYIPAEGKSAPYSLPLFITDESTNTVGQITIVIEQSEDGYTARIDKLTTYERKTAP